MNMINGIDLSGMNFQIGLGYLMLYIAFAICVLLIAVPLVWWWVLYIKSFIKDMVAKVRK